MRTRKKELSANLEDKKVVNMTINEFINFRDYAFSKHQDFKCYQLPHHGYVVEGDNTFMQAIGY
jgi:hypothetical protein